MITMSEKEIDRSRSKQDPLKHGEHEHESGGLLASLWLIVHMFDDGISFFSFPDISFSERHVYS
jgi:hypothetical protein